MYWYSHCCLSSTKIVCMCVYVCVCVCVRACVRACVYVCYFSQRGIDATGDRVCQFNSVISVNMGQLLLETEFVNSYVLFQSTWDRCYGDIVCQFMCVISVNMGYMLVETEFLNSCVLFQSTWDRCYWRQSLSTAPWQGVGHRCSSGNNQMLSHRKTT